jgi:hypothetical protein
VNASSEALQKAHELISGRATLPTPFFFGNIEIKVNAADWSLAKMLKRRGADT